VREKRDIPSALFWAKGLELSSPPARLKTPLLTGPMK